MTIQLNNLVELAANLVLEGKATVDNALSMAIELDTDNCIKALDDMRDKINGYINPESSIYYYAQYT